MPHFEVAFTYSYTEKVEVDAPNASAAIEAAKEKSIEHQIRREGAVAARLLQRYTVSDVSSTRVDAKP